MAAARESMAAARKSMAVAGAAAAGGLPAGGGGPRPSVVGVQVAGQAFRGMRASVFGGYTVS